MVTLCLYRRIAAWLAMLAMVVGALAPAVAQAVVAGHDRAAWLEVCSVSGMVWVKADSDEASRQSNDSVPIGTAKVLNCAWCMLHGDAPGVLSSAETPVTLTPRLTDLPPAYYLNPVLSTVWVPAQSRAPPSLA